LGAFFDLLPLVVMSFLSNSISLGSNIFLIDFSSPLFSKWIDWLHAQELSGCHTTRTEDFTLSISALWKFI
jgi:hypothetical protein